MIWPDCACTATTPTPVMPSESGKRLDLWVPAAGVPWFVTLFGRDALTVSFQTLALTPRLALGSLRALGALPSRRIRRQP